MIFRFSRIKNRLQPIECYEYLKHMREYMRMFKYVKEAGAFSSCLAIKIQVEWGEKLPFCQSLSGRAAHAGHSPLST